MSATSARRIQWPEGIQQAPLPDGYAWVCLGQALGLKDDNDEHPWYVRLDWRMKGGKRRMLRLSREHFPSAREAVEFAVKEAEEHSERRKLKERAA